MNEAGAVSGDVRLCDGISLIVSKLPENVLHPGGHRRKIITGKPVLVGYLLKCFRFFLQGVKSRIEDQGFLCGLSNIEDQCYWLRVQVGREFTEISKKSTG